MNSHFDKLRLPATRRVIGALTALLCLTPFEFLRAAEANAPSAPVVDFRTVIQPILAQRCYRCHGPDQAKGGLRLNSRDGAFAELESGGHAIVANQPSESLLLERITATEEGVRMPPEGKPLTADQVRALNDWIASGAKWENHWAFEPVMRPTLPQVDNEAWNHNPIDRFVFSKLAAHGLAPAPPAEKASLLRRLYFDLTGLPPSPEEIDAFLADTTDDAYEKVVDRLLCSPRYGERWGRHWLDLVRFADTNSFERDGVKPNAWRFRDYVIRSFNDDKPYDRFLREQLAGDELPDASNESLTATGYYRLGLWDDEPADPLQARYDELDDIVATTGQVFLGLTINCARCHDHKLDPIPQADYYRMVSFFNEIDRYNTKTCQVDISPPEIAEQYRDVEARKATLREAMLLLERTGIEKMSAEDQRRTEGPERDAVLKKNLQSCLSEESWQEYSKRKDELTEVEKTVLPPRETLLGLGKTLEGPPPAFILARGNPHVPGAEVQPAFLTALGGGEPSITDRGRASRTSGRRTALADWIASPTNPLTARVVVNRVWQHHFGRGLVRSSSNFGSLGNPPTHPELLDWLAAEFVDLGWHFKPLHRLIVTSNAYRMSSAGNSQALAKDPENDLLWRFDMRRLGAEEVRDAMLAATGQLNLKMFGPGTYPKMSQEVLQTQSIPGNGWGDSSPEEQNRRSIYIHIKRSLVLPILAEFDVCDTDGSCAVRFATTQPTQALAMLNGEFAHEQAAALGRRVKSEVAEGLDGQIARALRLALARPVESRQIEQGARLIERLQTQHGLTADKAFEYYCLTVLNLNEFVYLD
ncbi:MAG TPA: PSD1 and planctomycete cytochrome C domain-containing protein [Pirellulales bacterium]|jgi:mono/diheme cytochrome c family protein